MSLLINSRNNLVTRNAAEPVVVPSASVWDVGVATVLRPAVLQTLGMFELYVWKIARPIVRTVRRSEALGTDRIGSETVWVSRTQVTTHWAQCLVSRSLWAHC